MEILIVNCCHVQSTFEKFCDLVKKTVNFKIHGQGNAPNFIVRKMDELSDFVCHWHHDVLDQKCKSQMIKFDKMDMIFLYGDITRVPWDPMYMQVVTLLFMSVHCHKPVFTCGSTACVAVYTIATQGARFHILNGPDGGSLPSLKRYPRYSFGSGPFPSGWLDNQTGDVYVYEKDKKRWIPNCNVGMYRLPITGKPIENKYQQASRHYSRETRKIRGVEIVEALECKEEVCHVRNECLQHFSIQHLHAQEFVAPPLQEWHINGECALPPGCDIQVIANSLYGPVLLAQHSLLIVAMDLTTSSGTAVISTIISNFVTHTKDSLVMNDHTINSSLFVHIFGERGLGNGKFDSVLDAKSRAPPLWSQPVPSILTHGPTFVDTPVYGIFFKNVSDEMFDLTQMLVAHSTKTLGRAPINVLRDPQMNHLKRMTSLLLDSKYPDLDKICFQAVETGEQDEKMLANEGFLDSTKAAMAGRIIHTHNLRNRRAVFYPELSPDGAVGKEHNKQHSSTIGAVKGARNFILSSPAINSGPGPSGFSMRPGRRHVSVSVPVGGGRGGVAGNNSEEGSVATNGSDESDIHMNVMPGTTAAWKQMMSASAPSKLPLSARDSVDNDSIHSYNSHHHHQQHHHHSNNGGSSRRPSSAASLLPRHHPRIKQPLQEIAIPTPILRRKTIYFIDPDEDDDSVTKATSTARNSNDLKTGDEGGDSGVTMNHGGQFAVPRKTIRVSISRPVTTSRLSLLHPAFPGT